MLRLIWILVFASALVGGAGCANRSRPAAATRPAAENSRAEMPLSAVQSVIVLPVGTPSTNPSAEAPLAALELFAQGRRAMLDNQRFTAIDRLQQAIAMDPDSFESRYALGEAQLGRSLNNADSIASFEAASAIRPDHTETHVQLGRQYLSKSDLDRALYHLRLATLTTGYSTDDGQAAVTDFYLAKALQQAGYLRAATDQYEILAARIERPTIYLRDYSELVYLVSRPALLQLQIGELYEKRGKFEQALAAYQRAESLSSGGLEFRSHVIHALVSLGRNRQAVQQAADAVRKHGASPESLELLREVYQRLGREGEVEIELRRLHEEHPDDQGILFALVDVLAGGGKESEAESLLRESIEQNDFDVAIVRRLYNFYDDRDQTEKAAELLVIALAAQPGMLRDLSPMWNQLLSPTRKNRLKLSELQSIPVPESAEASKLFWISRIADMWNRDALARSSLEKAVTLPPPFPPAYRVRLADIWQRNEWDTAAKIAETNVLIDRARGSGNESLALELEGISLLNQKKSAEALEVLARATKAGESSPDLQMLYASALRAQGKESRSEQVLWKVISDYPTCEDAYAALFRTYMDIGSVDQAVKVLQTWLSADPSNISARLLQATIYVQARQQDNAEVLGNLEVFYQQSGRMNQFLAKLEALRVKQPNNQALSQELVRMYSARNQAAEALRVLDEARAAAAEDADLLYHVAHLYAAVDQSTTSEEVLEQVLRIDPSHASARNDLGYTWADQGKNLKRAEELIRVAVEAEPDNQSFLDSLGWVLYKRGEFDESRECLERAIGPATFPDPVVLDHLGDVLYRLGRHDEATAMWKRSLAGLKRTGGQRDDLRQLQLLLDKKISQAESGQPASVAPIVETGTQNGVQAKN
jgi:tetratricopeptide (TPR) repeat protein